MHFKRNRKEYWFRFPNLFRGIHAKKIFNEYNAKWSRICKCSWRYVWRIVDELRTLSILHCSNCDSSWNYVTALSREAQLIWELGFNRDEGQLSCPTGGKYSYNRYSRSLSNFFFGSKIVFLNFSFVLMPTSHIQRSPAEFVDRPNVAEFHIRQGVERIFRLKSTLSHFGRG